MNDVVKREHYLLFPHSFLYIYKSKVFQKVYGEQYQTVRATDNL